MTENGDTGPGPIAWWRFLAVGAMMVALYVANRVVLTSHHTDPWLLVPTVLLGGAVGLVVGRRQVAGLMSPRRREGHRGRRRRLAMPASSARAYLAGLIGFGLVLGQALSASAMEWLLIGTTGLMAGGAGHAWVMARHHGRVTTSLAD